MMFAKLNRRFIGNNYQWRNTFHSLREQDTKLRTIDSFTQYKIFSVNVHC